MIIRNGINSNLRARGRTALFTLLIFFLTLVLMLGLGVRLYCTGAIASADESFRSIAVVEYMGAEYPYADEPDEFARSAFSSVDDKAVLSIKGVKGWSRTDTSLVYADGYVRSGAALPYKSTVIFEVFDIKPSQDGTRGRLAANSEAETYNFEQAPILYSGTVNRTLYAYENRGAMMVTIDPGETDFTAEKGQKYILHGEIGDTVTRGLTSIIITPFENDPDIPPYFETTGVDDSPMLHSGIFADYATMYRLANNYLRRENTASIEDLKDFNQGILYLEDGRFPERGEAEACIISGDVAEALELHVGDSITVTELSGTEEDRFSITGIGEERAYKIVGITNIIDDYKGYIWTQTPYRGTTLFGYYLGTVSLENSEGEAAVETLRSIMPDKVRVTLYDQGYASAVSSYKNMSNTALVVLLSCAVGVMTVLVLYAFLFVGRQQETVQILSCLGTPRVKIMLWLLSGSSLISALGIVPACAAAIISLPRLISAIERRAVNTAAQLPYSETAIGIVKEAVLRKSLSNRPLLYAAILVFLVSIVLCVLFLARAFRTTSADRGRSHVRIPHGTTSVLASGGIRFALLSIARGGLRSLIVPLVSLVMTVLMIVTSGTYDKWIHELDDVQRNTKIDGQVLSLNGAYYSGLVLTPQNARAILALDNVDEMYVSQSWHYWLPSEMPAFSDSSFGREHRNDWILKQPEIVSLNSLKAAKEFYYTEPSVTWLDNWDETCLANPSFRDIITTTCEPYFGVDLWHDDLTQIDVTAEPYPAVVSAEFIKAHSLSLGDELSVSLYYPTSFGDWEPLANLKIVGSYKQTGGHAYIYVPLSFYFPQEWLFGEEDVFEGIKRRSYYNFYSPSEIDAYLKASIRFSTCRFTLSSAESLEMTRTALRNASFSWVRHMNMNRTTVLLRDTTYLELTDNLERSIAMGRRIFVLIFAVVAVVGFVISWLMINGRKQEFAIMRGFGAKRARVFISFFSEQALLCLTGTLLGFLSLAFLPSGGTMMLNAIALYLVCYLAGSAVSVLLIGRTNLMELLTERE